MDENPYATPATEITPQDVPTTVSHNSPYGGYRNIGWLHYTILGLLGVFLITAIGQVFVVNEMNNTLRVLDTAPDSEDANQTVNRLESVSTSLAAANGVFFLLTVIFWSIWKNKSCKNAWFFQARKYGSPAHSDQPTPGFSVGYYFIPILNFWKPFQAMAFIRDQVSNHTKCGLLLGFWWGAWIIWTVSERVITKMDSDFETLTGVLAYNQRILVGSVIEVVTAILAALVIHQLSKGQTKKARKIGAIR